MKKLSFCVFLFLVTGVIGFSQDKGKTQEVIGEGVGASADLALKDAFRNAVRQVVGAYVDAETLVKNDELVEDKILTYSNGFIKTFSEVEGSKKVQGGVYRVKIKAVVETVSVIAKLKASNISIKEVDGKGLFAEVVSKMDSEKDAAALLKKSFEGFPRSCLKIEVKGEPKLLEKSDTKATVLIQIEGSVDMKAFKAFSSKLQTVLEKLVIEKKLKGEFLIKSKESVHLGCKFFEVWNGRIDTHFKKWMPNGLNNYGRLSDINSIILALCTHSNEKADNLDFAYYSLDKSLIPFLASSAFEVLTGKLALVDENGESVIIDRFEFNNYEAGPMFQGSLTAASGWLSNDLRFLRPSINKDERTYNEKNSGVFFISPVFFSTPNNVVYYKPTLLINRKIELSLEELKKIKKAKVEISPP